MKPTFRYNSSGVKSSIDQYRNINGIHYICWTSDPEAIPDFKQYCKALSIKYRVAGGELYVEKERACELWK